MRKGALLWTLGLVVLVGCSVGPRYSRPHAQVAGGWATPLTAQMEQEEESCSWWDLFHDPLLSSYVQTLTRNNLDVRIAFEKVCEARMRLLEANANRFPYLYADLAEDHSVPGGVGAPMAGGSPFDVEQTRRRGLLSASWEVDLFGRLARKRDSARAWERMTCWDAYGVKISLIGDLAGSYFQVRGIQRQLACLEEELKVLQEKAAFTQWRVDQGIDDSVTADQVVKEIKALESVGHGLEDELRVHSYHLAVLLGKAPGELSVELADGARLPHIPEKIAVGLPASLTRRRPDIQWAEWQFVKATADEGFAIADRFPHLTLSGSAGYEWLKLGNLSWDGVAWSYGGQLLSTLFDGGASGGRVEQQRSLRRQASLVYEKTLLAALEETESNLAHFYAASAREQAALDAFHAQERITGSAVSKGRNGLVSSLQVMDQRRLFHQERRTLIQRRTESLAALVALYKSLGGGWNIACR